MNANKEVSQLKPSKLSKAIESLLAMGESYIDGKIEKDNLCPKIENLICNISFNPEELTGNPEQDRVITEKIAGSREMMRYMLTTLFVGKILIHNAENIDIFKAFEIAFYNAYEETAIWYGDNIMKDDEYDSDNDFWNEIDKENKKQCKFSCHNFRENS